MIEKILNAMMLVGLSVVAMAYFSFEPTLAFIKGQGKIKEEIKEIKIELQTVKDNIGSINSLINKSAGLESLDVSSKIQELNNVVISSNEQVQTIKLLMEKDPSTLANLREINLKYNVMMKNLDELNSNVDKANDKIYSDALSSNATLWGVLLFIGGFILNGIVSHFKEVNKTS